MDPERARRFRKRRAAAAVAVAAAINAALLSVMGLVRPRSATPPADDAPAVDLQLTPIWRAAAGAPIAAAARKKLPIKPAAAGKRAELSTRAVEQDAADGPDHGLASMGAGEAPGCDPEDLLLLTEPEKARCRNQIDVARARRAAAVSDAGRAARMAAMRQAAPVDGIAPEKRAYYDAVQTAKAARNDFSAWERMRAHGKSIEDLRMAGDRIVKPDIHDVVTCKTTFGANRGRPPGPRYGLRLGPFSCPLAPPPGALNEEAQIAPP